jgi:hypothetical protein
MHFRLGGFQMTLTDLKIRESKPRDELSPRCIL